MNYESIFFALVLMPRYSHDIQTLLHLQIDCIVGWPKESATHR